MIPRSSNNSLHSHAEDTIRELAASFGITAERVDFDDWLDKAAELSGQEDGSADEVEQILINMRRAKVIDPQYARELFRDYIISKFGCR